MLLNCCGENSELTFNIARIVSEAVRKTHDEEIETLLDNNVGDEE